MIQSLKRQEVNCMDKPRDSLDALALGIKLEKARSEQGLSQDDVAEMCAITPVHVRHIESGHRLPSLPLFVSLCNVLKVSPMYLLSDSIQWPDGQPDAYQRFMKLLLNMPPHNADMIVAMLETMCEHLERNPNPR